MAITVPIVSEWDPKGIDKSIRDIQKAEGAWGKTGAAVNALTGPALAVAGAFAVGAGASIKAASDLGESVNAVGLVFGDSSSKITNFAKTASTSAGLSERAFNEMATNTGALLTNMGFSTEEAADSTIVLAQRAADMASVFNTDVETALGAINAGLRGESEPLRAFGVGLSDAAIKAKAMEMGIYDGTGAIDANAKAIATQALIMEQTNKTAGDFSATQDSVANASKVTKAEVENLGASLGEALLPFMQSVLGVGLAIVGWMQENQTAVMILAGGFGALAAIVLATKAAMSVYETAAIIVKGVQKLLNIENYKNIASWVGTQAAVLVTSAAYVAHTAVTKTISAVTKAWTAIQWLLNAALAANPITLVVLAIVALVAIVVTAYQKCDWFRALVDKLWQLLKNSLGAAFDAVSTAIGTFVGWLKDAWEWAQKVIDKVGAVIDKINPFKGGVELNAPGVESAVRGRTAGTTAYGRGSVTINVNGARSPLETARQIKRALEGYDIQQGRAPGSPLAVAW